MLWYKVWLDTRWRFLIGLVLLVCSAAASVIAYPRVMALLPLVPTVDAGGELGRRIREAADLARSYRGYIWSQWYRQMPVEMGTLFAVLLGTGGVISQSTGGGTLFTLSLPVSRARLLTVRAGAGLVELFLIAFLPSLMIPLLSPAVGQVYGFTDVLAHGLCLFIVGCVFYGLAILLSTAFGDIWRPLLLACAAAFAVGLADFAFPDVAAFGVFRVMSAETYFRTGRLPWIGLALSTLGAAVMLYAAARNFIHKDF